MQMIHERPEEGIRLREGAEDRNAKEGKEIYGKEGGEAEERTVLPLARYRIVTRAFTRRTPPQDRRRADLC